MVTMVRGSSDRGGFTATKASPSGPRRPMLTGTRAPPPQVTAHTSPLGVTESWETSLPTGVSTESQPVPSGQAAATLCLVTMRPPTVTAHTLYSPSSTSSLPTAMSMTGSSWSRERPGTAAHAFTAMYLRCLIHFLRWT